MSGGDDISRFILPGIFNEHDSDLTSEKNFRCYLDSLFVITARILSQSGYLCPVAHLVVKSNPSTGEMLPKPGIISVLCRDMEDDQGKNRWAGMIRDMCAQFGAIGAVLVNEGWLVIGEWDTTQPSPSEDPRRVEVVCFMVEHVTFGNELWAGKMIRHEDDTVSMETPILHGPAVQGRFARLIPQQTMN